MRKRHTLVLLGALVTGTLATGAQQPIRVLIVDGQNNHNWQATTPVLGKLLAESGLFQTTVVTSPPRDGDFAAFKPDFAKYQVVVSNYNGTDWPADVAASFEKYIANGGGLVSFHAADNAFPGWRAFNEMIGVGGWGDRDERAGPFWYYKDGTLISDAAPGRAGSHGARLPFKVIVRTADHPITNGLPPEWMHHHDELYARLRGPGKNMTVLASAFSDPRNAGSGHDEPMLMVLPYGKGRIFHTTLGHDLVAMSSIDFITTFLRGTEWAATGAVTQKVPSTYPTPTAASYRADIVEMDPGYWKPAAPPPAQAQPQGVAAASPASQRPPQTATPQSYPREQVEAGQPLFAAQCGFCHGRDTAGGASGPDLTRSALVAADIRGDKIGPVVRNGRPDKGMPPSSPSPAELTAIVAFIHDQKAKANSEQGGRRSVDVADLQTGNADAGKQYFNGAGGCAKCHATGGDLAGIGKRYEGLALLQRMLYPGSGRDAGPPPAPPTITVTLPSGEVVAGKLAYRDEFTIALTDASGWYRSWPVHQIKFIVSHPLDAHIELLGKYTDDDMHNLLAYLHTLR